MIDISDLREGDEIEVTIRYTVVRVMDVLAARHGEEGSSNLRYLLNIAERVTVVRPEIIPGQPYVDADGKFYIGRVHHGQPRVVSFDEGRVQWYGGGDWSGEPPMPAGLRPAKVVPQ